MKKFEVGDIKFERVNHDMYGDKYMAYVFTGYSDKDEPIWVFLSDQPERSKREDLPDNWDCKPCFDLYVEESKGKILDYRYRRMRCSEHCGNIVSPK